MMNMCIKFCVCFLIYVTCLTSCAVKGDVNQGDGLVLTTHGSPIGTQLVHIPAIPYYEPPPQNNSKFALANSKVMFLSVDFDYRENILFLYDYYLRTMVACYNYTGTLDRKQMLFQPMHIGVSKDTIQIAYDWVSKTLYWVDSGYRWIVAVPVGDTSKIAAGYFKIIADDNFDEPEALALDPIQGYLFWADNGKHPKIERAAMDGSNRTTLIRASLLNPRALEVDIVAKRIYWTDSTSDTIETADYDGNDRTIIRRISGTTLLDLAIFRDLVMASDIVSGQVFVLNKTDGSTVNKTIKVTPAKIYGIAVFKQENQPMSTDYCAALNCPHLCISEVGGAKCVCAEGYLFNATTKNCTEAYGRYHRAVVFATADKICLVDIRSWSQMLYTPTCVFSVVPQAASTTVSPTTAGSPATTDHPLMTMSNDGTTPTPYTPGSTVDPSDEIVLMDVDMVERVVYFSTVNNTIYSRALDLPLDNPYVQKISDANGKISGLVYDWNDRGNLYYSESDTGSIHVVNVLNGRTKRISNTSYAKPQHLVLLPLKRQLAWIAYANSKYYIERMDITGAGYMRYKAEYSNPRGMVVDHEAQAFYVLNRKIWKQPYNETSPRADYFIAFEETASIFLKYKDYLGYVYTMGDSVSRMKTYTLMSAGEVNPIAHGEYKLGIRSMKVLDASVLKTIPDPCAANNGDCEQLCQLHYEEGNYVKKCSCTIGFTQANDPNKCTPNRVFDDNFALVTDWTNDVIYQINLNQPDQLSAFKSPRSGTFVGVLYNHINKRIVWTELSRRYIYSAAVDGTDFKVLATIGYTYGNRIALDEGSGNIYYTTRQSFFQRVGVIAPFSSKPQVLITLPGTFKIYDIVLHPQNGKMYFAVHNRIRGGSSYIGRADMDGKNFEKLIMGSHVRIPIGLAIDYTHHHLYWTDYFLDTISQCDLDGQQCKVVVKEIGADMHDVDTDGEYIYFTAWNRNHIEKRPISNFNSSIKLGVNPELGKLEALAIYKSTTLNKQPVSASCQGRDGRGKCGMICLPKKGGSACGCLGDQLLLSDGRTCSGMFQCDDFIRQTVTDLDGSSIVIKVFIKDQCPRYNADVCAYNCPPGYMHANDAPTEVACGIDGWQEKNTTLCQIPQCPRKIYHGTLDPKCSNKPGGTCAVTCATGYKNVTSEVICRSDSTWHPQPACEELLCPTEFNNGKINVDCDRKPNGVCNYACNLGLDPNKGMDGKIQCLPSGKWNLTQQMCVERVVVTLEQKGGEATSSASTTTGLAVGLGLLFVALVVVVIVAFRRGRQGSLETPYAITSFGNPSTDNAMENPIYRAEDEPDMPQDGTNGEHVAQNNSGPL